MRDCIFTVLDKTNKTSQHIVFPTSIPTNPTLHYDLQGVRVEILSYKALGMLL